MKYKIDLHDSKMRTIILTIILNVIFLNLKGQDSLLYISYNPEKLWKYYNTSKFDSTYFRLPIIENLTYEYSVRISFNSQIVDIFSEKNNRYEVIVTNTIRSYEDNSETGQNIGNQFVVQRVYIEEYQARKIANYLFKSGLYEVPTDTLIPNWRRPYLHCGSISLQYNINGKYAERIFHCPWNQPDTVEFKQLIVSASNYIKDELKLDSLYRRFFYELPKGYTYSKDGYMMQYKMTEEEAESWQKIKPHLEYMQSVKDTLNSYLSKELTQLLGSTENLFCYNQFFLEISKGGRLKKIFTNTTIDDVWLFGEYYRCKRKIRRAFRKVEIDFISPERAYVKELHFTSEGGIIILQ